MENAELLQKIKNEIPEAFLTREDGLELQMKDGALFLVDPMIGEFSLDFLSTQGLYQRKVLKGKSEILAKALGAQKGLKTVFDATLGLGQDALFIRQLGFQVTGSERSPQVYALLADALRRAKSLRPEFELGLFWGEAQTVLSELSFQPEAIYIDPMFPEKKKSALPRKEMQIFRKLIGDDPDSEKLFDFAMDTAFDRVVVKRPVKAPFLKGLPTHSFAGQTVRYDFYSRRGG